LLLRASPHWQTFAQLWSVLKEFAQIGYYERAYLLNAHTVAECVAFTLGQDSPFLAKLHPQDVVKVKMGSDVKLCPNFGDLVELLCLLNCTCTTQTGEPNELAVPAPPTLATGKVLELPEFDRHQILSKDFLMHVFRFNISSPAVCKILAHWSWYKQDVSRHVLEILATAIDKYNDDSYPGVFLAYTTLFDIKDPYQSDRVDFGLTQLVKTMCGAQTFEKEVTACCRFILKLCERNAAVSRWLIMETNRSKWEWMEKWVAAHSDAGKP